MALRRKGHQYEPIAIGVTYNDWRYPVVTLSIAPGARVTVTLNSRDLSDEEASDQALSVWRYLNT